MGSHQWWRAKKSSESCREAVGIIDHRENRRCSLWNGFEFCHKTLALDCRYAPGHMVRRRRAAAKKRRNREKRMKMAGPRNAMKAATLLPPGLISLELSLSRAFIDSLASLLAPHIDTSQMYGAYGNRSHKEKYYACIRYTFDSTLTCDFHVSFNCILKIIWQN